MGRFHDLAQRVVVAALGLLFTLSPVVSRPIAGQTGPQRQAAGGIIPGQYIVMLRSDAADSAELVDSMIRPLGATRQHTFSRAIKGFSARMSAQAAQALARHPSVASVEPDRYVHTLAQTLPSGVDRIDADLNDAASIDGVDDRVDVDVAIIDTGIDLDHPDLNVFFDENFCSFFLCPFVTTGNDDNGHGTHVAGTVGALDNDQGVVGIAPGARLWALKALNGQGMGTLGDIIKAIDFVTENADQIEVVNMSLGAQGSSPAMRAAIQASVAAGVVYVVAAGNSAQDVYGNDGQFGTADDFFPAAYPEVLAVSAMGDTDGKEGGTGPATTRGTGDDRFADFTNFSRSIVPDNPVVSVGAAIDLAAPGVDVLSTWKDGGFNTISGTSMASPHVAGAVALEIAVNGRANDAAGVAAIRQGLIDKAQPQSGWGPASTEDPDSNPEALVNVASGPFNRPPQVSITSPADGATFDSGVMISFEGAAVDAEDGDLSDQLVWSSDLDGDLGTGRTISSTLSDGSHRVTATATDSGGRSASDSVQINVGVRRLNVSLTTDRPGYSSFQIARITIEVGDGPNPVEGAAVNVTITTSNGRQFNGAKVTDASGRTQFSLFIFSPLFGSGTYTAEARAEKDGFLSGTGSTTFEVR